MQRREPLISSDEPGLVLNPDVFRYLAHANPHDIRSVLRGASQAVRITTYRGSLKHIQYSPMAALHHIKVREASKEPIPPLTNVRHFRRTRRN
jgi:hypothetical protein